MNRMTVITLFLMSFGGFALLLLSALTCGDGGCQ